MNQSILNNLSEILEQPVDAATPIDFNAVDSVIVVLILSALDDAGVEVAFERLKQCATAGEIASLT